MSRSTASEVSLDPLALPFAPVKRIARVATQSRVDWSPPAIERLREVARFAIMAEAERLARRAEGDGRKTVLERDLVAPVVRERKDAASRYIAWLGECNELLARAAREKSGLPTLPPCPGVPVE